MRKAISLLILIFALFITASTVFAGVLPQAAEDELEDVSITLGTTTGGNAFDTTRNIGMRILTAAKVFVSGMALVYITLLGAYMIIFSENEDRIKSQRRQLTYVLVAFLFLNIPGLVYIVFFGDVVGDSRAMGTVGDVGTVVFWDASTLTGVNGLIPQLIGFFEIFIFGAAVLTFTWGLFRLLMSAGNEEIQKKAKNRIIYGILGLMFLGFARYWGTVIAKGDFFGEFATVGNKFLGLALYFAAPVVIGFLVLAAYYMIISAGDEEKVKKAKSIFTNTLIASVILLGAYSFVTDLATFTL